MHAILTQNGHKYKKIFLVQERKMYYSISRYVHLMFFICLFYEGVEI